MIVIRKTEDMEEKRIIDEILGDARIDNSISDKGISYIIKDDSSIVGGCNFIISRDYAIINFLVIDTYRRGEKLGDGLLRAVLNHCLSNKIKKAYFIGDNQYLIKKGFYKAEKSNEGLTLSASMNSDIILACDIEEFFSKGCSSCRRS